MGGRVTQSSEKFGLVRRVLLALGLSPEAVDDIIERILDFLFEKNKAQQPAAPPRFPYLLRDNFLSPAELDFYRVLQSAVGQDALIFAKVKLLDLFQVKASDPREARSLSNKIDRKHVDFLLCDPATVQPVAGIELDDKSHQRADRMARDEYVEQVFAAAGLPLVRVPVRREYSTADLRAVLKPHLPGLPGEAPATPVAAVAPAATPPCPKCGREMILRTSKSGANQGGKFWGCSDFPRCRGMLKYDAPAG